MIVEITDSKEKQAIARKVLEVFPLLWDEANPYQIYVMYLK